MGLAAWPGERLTARGLQVLGTLSAHTASVESVGFCDVLPYAASAALDGQVILWDVQARAVSKWCTDARLTHAFHRHTVAQRSSDVQA